MDILCTCCGEPWEVSFVLHEEPQAFERNNCVITACPACRGYTPDDQGKEEREYLEDVKELAESWGEDIDGFAALLEDFWFY